MGSNRRGDFLLMLIFVVRWVYGSSSSQEVPVLPVCSTEHSVCSALSQNGTGHLSTVRSVCVCPDGSSCPHDKGDDRSIVSIGSYRYSTCSRLDNLPECDPGQVSLRSMAAGSSLQLTVVCSCSRGYNIQSEAAEGDTMPTARNIYCLGDPNMSSEAGDSVGFQELSSSAVIPLTHSDQDDEGGIIGEWKTKRRDNFHFYKRSPGNKEMYEFYKRSGTPYSSLGRTFGSLSSFYKRAPFYKGTPYYKRDTKRAGRNSQAFYKRGLAERLEPYGKQELFSEFPESYNREASWKDFTFNPEEVKQEESIEEQLRGSDKTMEARNSLVNSKTEFASSHRRPRSLSRFYKRGDLSSFYKRGDLNSFYKRRDLDSFYKRGDLSSFYKRAGLSRFYKRGDLKSFYKRDLNRFYKRSDLSSFYTRGELDSFYKRGDLDSFYKRGDLSSFYKRGDLSSFYKRGALSNFYKRSRTGGDLSSFYKRAPLDHSTSSLYKRAPLDHTTSSFYKRAPLDHSTSSLYKRVPLDHTTSSFYKRSPLDHTTSSFYKRSPLDHTTSSFYKRSGHIPNSFYNQGHLSREARDLSSFYKRAGQEGYVDPLYTRSYNNLQSFYKRGPNFTSSFYKRSPNFLSSFYKRADEISPTLPGNIDSYKVFSGAESTQDPGRGSVLSEQSSDIDRQNMVLDNDSTDTEQVPSVFYYYDDEMK